MWHRSSGIRCAYYRLTRGEIVFSEDAEGVVEVQKDEKWRPEKLSEMRVRFQVGKESVEAASQSGSRKALPELSQTLLITRLLN